MGWPPKVSPLRRAVFHLLLHPDLANVACTAEQLAGVLTLFVSETSTTHVVTADHIKNAFKGGCNDEYEYKSLSNVKGGEDGDKLVFRQSRGGSARAGADRPSAWEVTRYNGGGSAGKALQVHPLDKALRHSKIGDAVPKDVKDAFVECFIPYADTLAKRAAGERKTKGGGANSATNAKKGGTSDGGRPRSASAVQTPSNAKRPRLPTSPQLSQKERERENLMKERDQLVSKLSGVLSKIKVLQQEIDSEMAGVEASTVEQAVGTVAVSSESAAEEGRKTIHYTISGVKGKVLGRMDLKSVVLEQDLIDNMLDLPAELDGSDNADRRDKNSYSRVNHGSGEIWCPVTHTLLAKNRQNEIMGHHNLVKKTGKLFDHSQCTIGDEAKRWMAAFDMHAYGASDEGKVMAHAGALSAFLTVQLGYKISPGDIGRALPSRATQASMEFNLAADCLIKVCHEIKKDNARHLGLITDHGHRGDQDHFVKLVIWAGFDEDDNWTIKYFCLDVDSGGHSALEAAVAVKKSVTAFQDLLNEVVGERVEIKVITGDSGGGAKVQSLHPALVDCDVMDLDSQLKPCGLHGGVKPLERACVETVGAQGIGARTPIQLSWLFVRLMKYLRTSLDRKGLDDLWKSGVEALSTNPTWQRQAKEHSQAAYDQFVEAFETMSMSGDDDDDEDDDVVDLTNTLLSGAPTNLQDPVFSRWGTVLAAAGVLVHNYMVVFFIAKMVKETNKSGSYAWQLACAMISLMNNKSEPEFSGPVFSLDEFIDSFTADGATEYENNESLPTIEAGNSPIFYTALCFLDGFNKAFVEKHYNWQLQDNPILGKNTSGQMVCYLLERAYIMNSELKKLENGGWRDMPEFLLFRSAMEGIAEGDDGTSYFKKFVDTFFERYRLSFELHVLANWLNENTFHYGLGGTPAVAKEIARWIVDFERIVASMPESDDDDSDDGLVDDDQSEFEFSDVTVNLSKYHKMGSEEIEVNLRKLMRFVTTNVDRNVVSKQTFVIEHMDHIRRLAGTEGVVDMWNHEAPEGSRKRKIIETTWGHGNEYHDYKPFARAIWQQIMIHAHHQQRCELFVQMCNLVSQAGMTEARRSSRALIVSILIRTFNAWGLERRQETVRKENAERIARGEKTKPVPARLWGSHKADLFGQYLEGFFKKVDAAKVELKEKDADAYDRVVKRMKSNDKKASAEERRALITQYKSNMSGNWTHYKAEEARGIEKTALMQGGVLFRLLTMKHNMMDHVEAEIKARGIKMSAAQRRDFSIAEKRSLIRKNEFQARVVEEKELKEAQVTYFKPKSSLMKGFINRQAAILKAESDIDNS